MSKFLVAVRNVVRAMEFNALTNSALYPVMSGETPIYDQLEREWVARHGQSVLS